MTLRKNDLDWGAALGAPTRNKPYKTRIAATAAAAGRRRRETEHSVHACSTAPAAVCCRNLEASVGVAAAAAAAAASACTLRWCQFKGSKRWRRGEVKAGSGGGVGAGGAGLRPPRQSTPSQSECTVSYAGRREPKAQPVNASKHGCTCAGPGPTVFKVSERHQPSPRPALPSPPPRPSSRSCGGRRLPASRPHTTLRSALAPPPPCPATLFTTK